jgi:hypothetical protein
VLIFFLTQPLGLSWNKKHGDDIEIEGYNYYFGSVTWGLIVYIGKEDIIGAETELQVEYSSKKMATALLILGPAGLNVHNCIAKYKKMVSLLNGKYGKYRFRHEVKDPLANDLITVSACDAIGAGLREVRTFWHTPTHMIEATVIGDEGEYFIEVSYKNLSMVKALKADKKRKLYERL